MNFVRSKNSSKDDNFYHKWGYDSFLKNHVNNDIMKFKPKQKNKTSFKILENK